MHVTFHYRLAKQSQSQWANSNPLWVVVKTFPSTSTHKKLPKTQEPLQANLSFKSSPPSLRLASLTKFHLRVLIISSRGKDREISTSTTTTGSVVPEVVLGLLNDLWGACWLGIYKAGRVTSGRVTAKLALADWRRCPLFTSAVCGVCVCVPMPLCLGLSVVIQSLAPGDPLSSPLTPIPIQTHQLHLWSTSQTSR